MAKTTNLISEQRVARVAVILAAEWPAEALIPNPCAMSATVMDWHEMTLERLEGVIRSASWNSELPRFCLRYRGQASVHPRVALTSTLENGSVEDRRVFAWASLHYDIAYDETHMSVVVLRPTSMVGSFSEPVMLRYLGEVAA